MEIDIAQERFVAHGLVILARNYLDVYPYDHWSDKVRRRRALGRGGCRAGSDRHRLPPQVLPGYERGSRFQPSTVEMVDGETSPPQLLTEADLIALMEKHGIGQWLVRVGPGGSGAFPAAVTRALGSTPAPELQGGLEQLGARAGCRACERKSTVQVARSFLPRATALRRPRVGSCLLPLGVSAGPPCPGPVQRRGISGPHGMCCSRVLRRVSTLYMAGVHTPFAAPGRLAARALAPRAQRLGFEGGPSLSLTPASLTSRHVPGPVESASCSSPWATTCPCRSISLMGYESEVGVEEFLLGRRGHESDLTSGAQVAAEMQSLT